jgi:predicted  nucleic acid-binding Zn-ribbon protein
MERAISEIVGRAVMDEGGSTQAYRALRSLLCATCGAGIAEGSLFTRRRVKGVGVRIMPQCRACSPFTLQADRKEKSALLRSLLAEQPTDSAGQAKAPARNNSENTSQAQHEEKKKVDEAVRRRLGPALNRGRFGRKF